MPPGRERKMVSKRTMVPGVALLLVTSMTTAGATDTDAVAVLPVPLGEEETETVLAVPPPPVRSWMSGDVDDPGGVPEYTAADYPWRSRSRPGLLRAGAVPERVGGPHHVRAIGDVRLRRVRVQGEPGGQVPDRRTASIGSLSPSPVLGLGGHRGEDRELGTELRQELQAVKTVQTRERQQQHGSQVRH